MGKPDKDKIETRLHGLKMKAAIKLANRRKKGLINPATDPRYDDVYFEGVKWLNSL